MPPRPSEAGPSVGGRGRRRRFRGPPGGRDAARAGPEGEEPQQGPPAACCPPRAQGPNGVVGGRGVTRPSPPRCREPLRFERGPEMLRGVEGPSGTWVPPLRSEARLVAAGPGSGSAALPPRPPLSTAAMGGPGSPPSLDRPASPRRHSGRRGPGRGAMAVRRGTGGARPGPWRPPPAPGRAPAGGMPAGQERGAPGSIHGCPPLRRAAGGRPVGPGGARGAAKWGAGGPYSPPGRGGGLVVWPPVRKVGSTSLNRSLRSGTQLLQQPATFGEPVTNCPPTVSAAAQSGRRGKRRTGKRECRTSRCVSSVPLFLLLHSRSHPTAWVR